MSPLRRVFVGTWLAYASFYLCRKNFSVLMPLLPFSKNELARLVFVYSLAYACGQFLTGTLADRVGARRVVATGMIVSALCAAGMAGAHLLWIFAALQLANGLAQACGWPPLVKITGAWFDPVQRGILMAWWSTNYVLGGLAATLLATWLATGPLSHRFGWSPGAVGPAALLLAAACVFLWLVRDAPVSGDVRRREVEPPKVSAWKEVLRSAPIWSIAICYFCLKLMRYTFLFWLPLYMVERLHYTAGQAGYTSSIYELVGFAGVPLAGYMSDRWMGGRRFPVGAAMMFGLALACLLFPVLGASGYGGNLVAIGLVGMLTFGPDTLMSGAATQDAVSSEATATAAGFVNGVGSAGQVVSPFLVAAVVPWSGWDGLFGLFVGAALLGGISLAIQWKTGGRRVALQYA